MKGSSFSIDRRIAAAAAIFGVLLQLFVFAIHGPASARSATASAQNAETFVICTAHGLSTILLDAEGNPVEPPSPIHQRTECDLCLSLNALTIAPPSVGFVLAAQPTGASPPPTASVSSEPYAQRAHRNRGPPSLSII